jgi:hypothetical protein
MPSEGPNMLLGAARYSGNRGAPAPGARGPTSTADSDGPTTFGQPAGSTSGVLGPGIVRAASAAESGKKP